MSSNHPIAPSSMYFESLRRTLTENPSLWNGLTLECAICREPMNLVGDGLPSSENIGSDGVSRLHQIHGYQNFANLHPRSPKDAVVLPCAHIFCKGCLFIVCYSDYGLADFLPTNVYPRPDPVCPACRTKLVFPDCEFRCRFPGIPFPRSSEAMNIFPPTLQGGITQGSRRCNSCRIIAAWYDLQHRVDRVMEASMPYDNWVITVMPTCVAGQACLCRTEVYLERTFGERLAQTARHLRIDTGLWPWSGPQASDQLKFVLRWRS